MNSATEKYLYDVLDSVNAIAQFTLGRSLDDYSADRMLRQAVERNFEIIGEALNRAYKHDSEVVSLIPAYRQVINFRNYLIHDYGTIDNGVVWELLTEDLPSLRQAIVDLLDEGGV